MFNLDEVIYKFKVMPNNEVNEILLDNMNNSGEKKILYVFAGPNGSGKSTLIGNFYKLGMFQNVKYVNADIYAKTLFKDEKSESERNLKAMEYAVDKMNSNMKTGDSVVYETVLSHPSKLDLIKEYKKHGYQVISVFITPDNPVINLQRINQRVKEGGHDVPPRKVMDRFYRSNKLKYSLKEISDSYYQVDNTDLPKITNIVLKNFSLDDENNSQNDL